eukprot:1146736-Pelagomonas_calceolata.AAC.2
MPHPRFARVHGSTVIVSLKETTPHTVLHNCEMSDAFAHKAALHMGIQHHEPNIIAAMLMCLLTFCTPAGWVVSAAYAAIVPDTIPVKAGVSKGLRRHLISWKFCLTAPVILTLVSAYLWIITFFVRDGISFACMKDSIPNPILAEVPSSSFITALHAQLPLGQELLCFWHSMTGLT